MKTTRLPSDNEAVLVLIGEPGEDAFQLLNDFAKDNQLTSAQLAGVEAFRGATVGWFDRDAKHYGRIPVDQRCELLPWSLRKTSHPELGLALIDPGRTDDVWPRPAPQGRQVLGHRRDATTATRTEKPSTPHP